MAYGFWRGRNAALWSRFPIGVAFGISGTLLQCLTEYAYRHTPVYFLVHILAGSLAAMYHMKKSGAFQPRFRVPPRLAERSAVGVGGFSEPRYPEGIVYR